MADYRIVCVSRDEDGAIEAVGYSQYGAGAGYDDVWTLEQARYAIKSGHRLYTVSPPSGAEADVEIFGEGIRTNPDRSTDNNLDNLPNCAWGS